MGSDHFDGLAARRALTVASATVISMTALGEPPSASASREMDAHLSLPALQQVIKRFDFDNLDAAPNSLPTPFFRYVAPNQGFPPFGAMRLSNEVFCSGGGSLEFELGGGSMSARIPTAVIPILPFTDYQISVRVRTEGLRYARARLAAWLHDKTGQPIHDSRAQSQLIESSRGWATLSVDVHGRYADAADLVLELQVLQPAQFNANASDPDQPRMEDIVGRVWFDELVISHLPQISLAMKQAGNLVSLPDVPELLLTVDELGNDSLMARLRICDIDGEAVYDATFPAPRGRRAEAARVPITRCGWFRAMLDVVSQDGKRRQQSLDFVVMPPNKTIATVAERFGVSINEANLRSASALPELLESLRCGAAVLPVWNKETGSPQDQVRQTLLRSLIENLLRRNVDVTFTLDQVPDALARAANLSSNRIVPLMAMDAHIWQPFLDELLVNYGLEVNRWQFGSIQNADAVWSDQLQSLIATARRSLADYVPGPAIYTVWPAEFGVTDSNRLPGYALAIPENIPAESLADYAASFNQENSAAFAQLELPSSDEYSPRQRVTNLLIRGLYAWRAGFSAIFIDSPWHAEAQQDSKIQLDPEFTAWRALATHLRGKTFVSELPTLPGMHCWILRGTSEADSALVAWSDTISNRDPRPFSSQLAAGPVKVVDAFGNETTVNLINGMHTLQLTSMPLFIESANLNLVQFRSSIAIEPGFVPAVAKVHDHEIVIKNPWPVAISGSIRLIEDDDWKLTPNVQEFAIHPGGEVRLPLAIIPQRSILAGHKVIPAQVAINADQPYTMDIPLAMNLGLQNIELVATWTSARNPKTGELDLLITQAVTNHGEQPVRLDVYMLAEGVGQNRRMIPPLASGETAVRTFRIANGAAKLAGQQVRVGVAEHEGLTRLNKLLTISGTGDELAIGTDVQPHN